MTPRQPTWPPPPPGNLTLGPDEVHVWLAALQPEPDALARLESTLSRDEISRADRFVFEADRNRFVAVRGVLRELLGRYLGMSPADLGFSYGPEGKPEVSQGSGKPLISFNLSHSQSVAVFAFGYARELGIDVEKIQDSFAGEEIAERFFSPREIEELRALPPELRTDGFFLCWTRKEAYVKAQGAGLQLPLDSFDVSLTPGQPETLRSKDSSRWDIYSFEPVPGYVAALVGERKEDPWRLRHWDWRFPPSDPSK